MLHLHKIKLWNNLKLEKFPMNNSIEHMQESTEDSSSFPEGVNPKISSVLKDPSRTLPPLASAIFTVWRHFEEKICIFPWVLIRKQTLKDRLGSLFPELIPGIEVGDGKEYNRERKKTNIRYVIKLAHALGN